MASIFHYISLLTTDSKLLWPKFTTISYTGSCTQYRHHVFVTNIYTISYTDFYSHHRHHVSHYFLNWFVYSPQITCRRAAWPAPGTDSRPSCRSDTCRRRASPRPRTRLRPRASAGRAPRCTPRPRAQNPRTWARSSCCPRPRLRPRLRAPPGPHGPGGEVRVE